MEYISHSDYTSMLKNFAKETPKGLLKEALEDTGLMGKAIAAFERKFGNLTDQQKERFKQAIEMDYANDDMSKMTMDDLVQIFDASVGHDDEPEPDREDMRDIEDSDDENRGWENDDNNPFGEDLEQEGNAFTAGLAKTKKGGEFKVGSKKFTDKTNYDAPMKEMGDFSSVRARYPNNDGPFEGSMGNEVPTIVKARRNGDGIIALVLSDGTELEVSGNGLEGIYGGDSDNLDYYIGKKWDQYQDDYEPDTDADYEEPSEPFDMAEDKMEEGGYRGNLYHDVIAKLKKDGIVYDPDMRGKYKNDVVKAMTAVGYPDGEIYNSIVKDEHFIDDLILATNQSVKIDTGDATKQTVKIDTGDFDDHDTDDEKQYTYSNKRGSSSKSYDDYASDMGFEEGLNAPPFKATAGTVRNVKEDQAPFGLKVLSPDELKQLREYISSVREIKKAIQELVGKAKNGKGMMEATWGGPKNSKFVEGMKRIIDNHFESYLDGNISYDILIHMLKKIVGTLVKSSGEMMEAPNKKGKPGGKRDELIMTPAVTSEAKSKNPSLEKKVKDLMAKDKLTRREALEVIKAEKEHEQDEKGEQAKMDQYN